MSEKKIYIEIKLSEQLEDLALDLKDVSSQLSYISHNTEEEVEHLKCLSDLALDEYIQGKVSMINSVQQKVLEIENELTSIVERERGEDGK